MCYAEWIDNNDEMWIWNGNRVFCVAAEKEFMELGINVEENGYPASTRKQAEKILTDDGLLD
jgi:hypothetical protein